MMRWSSTLCRARRGWRRRTSSRSDERPVCGRRGAGCCLGCRQWRMVAPGGVGRGGGGHLAGRRLLQGDETLKILALDPGFAATGAVVMEWKGNVWWPAEMKCIRTTKDDAKLGVRVAEQDVTRVQETARALVELIDRHQIKMMVVELPHGGAQSSRAVRAMALSTGLIAGLVEYFGLAVEWLTPDDTRIAAVGSRKATKDQVMAGMAVR